MQEVCLDFLVRRSKLTWLLVRFIVFAVRPEMPAQSTGSVPIPTQIPGRNALLMGTDLYPKQWPEARWEIDLRMMEAAHLNIVRIAEFAGSRIESSEGHFDLTGWTTQFVSQKCTIRSLDHCVLEPIL